MRDGAARQYYLILVINFLHFLSWAVVEPYVPLFARALGAGLAEVGLLAALFAFLPVVGALPAGILVDRFGPRPVLFAGGLVVLAAQGLLVVARTVAWLYAVQLLAGVGELLIVLAVQTNLALLSADASRLGRSFAYLTFAVSAARALGPVIGGTLLTLLAAQGIPPETALRTTFAVGAAVALMIPAMAPFFRAPGPRVAAGPLWAHVRDIRMMAAAAPLRVPLLASATSLIAHGLRRSYFPLYMSQLGLGPAAIGLVFSAQDMASMAARPLFGWAYRTQGGGPLLSLALLLNGVAWGTLPMWRNAIALTVVAVGSGVAMGISQPLTMLMVTMVVDRARQGTGVALRLLANRMGQFATPLFVGGASALFGLPAAFHAVGLTLVTLYFLLRRMTPANAPWVHPAASTTRASA